MKRVAWTAALCAALIGCSKMTTFEGSPRVVNGRAGCEKKCAGQGLQFTGMVFVGEYSDACVCQVPGENLPNSGGEQASGGATGSAVAAVVTAKRIADEQARQQAQQQALHK